MSAIGTKRTFVTQSGHSVRGVQLPCSYLYNPVQLPCSYVAATPYTPGRLYACTLTRLAYGDS